MGAPVPVRDEVSKRLPGEGEPRAASSATTELIGLTEAFCATESLPAQTKRITELFSAIWNRANDHAFTAGLEAWVEALEQDPELRSHFQKSWQSMVAKLDSVSFFAESGLPAQKALLAETTRRVFQRLLPSAREDTDTARLFAVTFASPRAAKRFGDIDGELFARFAAILWDPQGLAAFPHRFRVIALGMIQRRIQQQLR